MVYLIPQTNRKLFLAGIIFIALCGNIFAQSETPSETTVKPIVYTLFVNVIHEPTSIPLIGFVNVGIGNHARPQIGFINYNSGDFLGFFQGSFINTIGGNLSGTQLGFINSTIGSVDGPQIGFINTTRDSISGAQIGFINTSGKTLKGLQLGFVNYVDSIESGIPIGLISIIRKGGYYALEYSFTEFHHFNIGLKLGIKQFYTMIFVSYNSATEANLKHLATGAGFGSLIPISDRLFFNPELNSTRTFGKQTQQLVSAAPYFGINLTNRFSIAAAPSLTLQIADGWERDFQRPLFGSVNAFNSEKLRLIVAARAALRVQL